MKHYETCTNCGGSGFVGHDCGEDTCCCLYPEENIFCEICVGTGVVEMGFDKPATDESEGD